jgi:AraC family transcriptional regulator
LDLLTRMDLALAYVEENLADEIDQEVLARIACCPAYNFYRMFSFITDISLTEYIRRRRLTMAAMELQESNIKVIDLALKYGYDSPVSFRFLCPKSARLSKTTLQVIMRNRKICGKL